MTEENKNDDQKDMDQTPGEQGVEDNQNPEEQQDSGFKVTKGMVILGLIVFVAVLFGVQKYIHFEGRSEDPKNKVGHTHKSTPTPETVHEELHEKQILHTHNKSEHKTDSQMKHDSGMPDKAVQHAAPVDSVHGYPVKDEKDIEAMIKEYIEKNPEIVAKALQNLNDKIAKERDTQSKTFVKDNIEKITTDKPYMGNMDGKTVIVEFFDYKCSYCRRSHLVLERVIHDYPDVKIILQPVPVLGKNSAIAVRAAIAVWNLFPEHFEKFHDALIHSSSIDENSILSIARKQGISTDALTNEMESQKVETMMNENLENAQKIGMRGVPTFIINGEVVPGSLSYEGFKDLLDKPTRSDVK